MSAKILIVEDLPDSREILAFQLRRLGYEVLEADNGEAAVRKAIAESPDVIIMDLWLPGISGFQATVKLKQEPKTTHIPVIAYTALEHKGCEDIAFQAGVSEFLLKPAPPEVFKQIIDKHLKAKP